MGLGNQSYWILIPLLLWLKHLMCLSPKIEENYNVNVHGFEIENRDILESINKPQS